MRSSPSSSSSAAKPRTRPGNSGDSEQAGLRRPLFWGNIAAGVGLTPRHVEIAIPDAVDNRPASDLCQRGRHPLRLDCSGRGHVTRCSAREPRYRWQSRGNACEIGPRRRPFGHATGQDQSRDCAGAARDAGCGEHRAARIGRAKGREAKTRRRAGEEAPCPFAAAAANGPGAGLCRRARSGPVIFRPRPITPHRTGTRHSTWVLSDRRNVRRNAMPVIRLLGIPVILVGGGFVVYRIIGG
jgi:hypothetical protein